MTGLGCIRLAARRLTGAECRSQLAALSLKAPTTTPEEADSLGTAAQPVVKAAGRPGSTKGRGRQIVAWANLVYVAGRDSR